MNQELLADITRLSEKYPDLRICQLIGNAIPAEEAARRDNDIYYIEDAQLLQWLRSYEELIDAATSSSLRKALENSVKRVAP